jgi:hypothetical protein
MITKENTTSVDTTMAPTTPADTVRVYNMEKKSQ